MRFEATIDVAAPAQPSQVLARYSEQRSQPAQAPGRGPTGAGLPLADGAGIHPDASAELGARQA